MIGLQFVNNHNIEYQHATDTELVIKVCPFCGDDKYRLYVNKEKGLFDCKKCGHQGNIHQLAAKYGLLDEISKPDILKKKYRPLDINMQITASEELKKNKKALDYLYSRGFTDKTIEHFKLGVQDEWIMIPHFFENELWNFKMRTFGPDKHFKRITGQPTILFNADNLDYSRKSIVVVEGEMDCIAGWQLGIPNIVSVTGGAQTFKPEWLQIFARFKTVYIILDSDDAGQKGAEKLAEKIGYEKTRNVILNTKDLNDYLRDGHHKQMPISEFIKANATRFSVKHVSRVSDYIDTIDSWFDEDGSMSGLQLTKFPVLNKLLGGFKKEDLIVMLADSGIGKTTWTLNAMLQMLQDDKKCLAFCLEGKINYYILRMMCIKSGKTIEQLRENDEEWEILKDEFSEYELYFYSGPQVALDPKKLTELLPVAVNLYDIDFVMIDNLQKFVRGVSDVFQRTGEAVSLLKDLAVDLKIPIFLISHITKKRPTDRDPISMHDAKSSSTIYQDADIVLIINVKKDGSYEMLVEKNRMGEGGMKIPIALDKQTATYYESDGIPQGLKALTGITTTDESNHTETDADWLSKE